jgi:hypothetical protein
VAEEEHADVLHEPIKSRLHAGATPRNSQVSQWLVRLPGR